MDFIQRIVGQAVRSILQTAAHELPDDQGPPVGFKRQLLRLPVVAALFRNLAPPPGRDGAVQRLL
jgi:hypothetical protein